MPFSKEDKPESSGIESKAEISKAEDSKDVKPEKVSMDATETGSTGSAIKTEKIASLVKPDGPFGGAKPMGISAAGEASSGTGNGFLADQNRTPTASKTRADSRAGKKVEKIANQLNYTPSEQAIVGMRESVKLSESPDSVQGFNGTPKTKSFKIQKKSGASPAELEYQRSVDIIQKDMVYFSDGQTIVREDKVQDIYPTTAADRITGEYTPGNFYLKRGNHLLDSIDFGCGANGLEYLIFNEHSLPCTPADSLNLDASSLAYPIAVNRAELEREDMDAKAGDEDKEGWSPIPRAIEEPGKVIALLHDLEYITGTELFLAEKKATQAMAFYLNKAVKDGQSTIKPGVEFLTGLVDMKQQGSSYNGSLRSVFNASLYRQGAASLIIPMYDSIAKYNNKADIVLQPRGPRMHFAGFRNGAGGFRVNPLFVNAFNDREMFGTVDHEYDPTKPIVMTDKAVAIHPISISEFGDFGPVKITLTATANEMTMSSTAGEFILPGNKQFYIFYKNNTSDDDVALTATTADSKSVINMSVGLANSIKKDETVELIISEQNVVVPDGYTALTAQPVLGKFIHLGALTKGSARIERGWINQGPYVYAYSDRRNVYTKEVSIPLVTGLKAYIESMCGKIYLETRENIGTTDAPSWVTRNVNMIATHSGSVLSLYDLFLAEAADFMFKDRHQYMTDVDDYARDHGYPFMQTVLLADALKTSPKMMNVKSIDEAIQSTTITGASALQWQFPELFGKLKVASSKTYALCPWYMCEYEYKSAASAATRNVDEFGICWPSIRNGNHLAAYDELYSQGERTVRLSLDRITDVTYGLTQGDYPVVYKHGLTTDGQVVIILASGNTITGENLLCMPRELGWSMTAPAGLLTPVSGSASHDYSVSQVGNSCYRTFVYHNVLAVQNPVGNVAPTINNDRAADYVQDYRIIDCIANNGAHDPFYGVSLGAGDCIDNSGDPVEGRSKFEILVSISGTKIAAANQKAIISDHTNLYFRLNVMPFIINPYDMINLYDGSALIVDPFELSYALGLAGFRFSDCSEDVSNKLTECDNLGRLLVEDPFIKDSYLMK